MNILGIDLSLTSPSLCVCSDQFDYDHCTFFYLTSLKKTIIDSDQLYGTLWPAYDCDMKRYELISEWVLSKVKQYKIGAVYLEDYAFGATGRVFNIAENTGVLKYKLWKTNTKVITVPPTVIKKFATGKGNANKEKMQESFMSETGVNLKPILQLTDKQWNPSSDIIDSYYICKYGVNCEKDIKRNPV